MNKKLISLAVAAAMTAPAAALAEATLYGQLHVSLDYADVNNVILPEYEAVGGGLVPRVGPVRTRIALRFPRLGRRLGWSPIMTYPQYVQVAPGADFEGWGMSSGGYVPGNTGNHRESRIGVKGSEDLGGGLKAIYQVEFQINLNDGQQFHADTLGGVHGYTIGQDGNIVNNRDTISYRNTFVGLAGNWGTALVGRHDTPLYISTAPLDLFEDTMADYNGTVGFRDIRPDNVVAYLTPNWNGFQLAGAIVPGGGTTAGYGLNLNSDSIAEHWSVAGIYSNGPWYASLAYEALGYEAFNDQTTSVYWSSCPYTTVPAGPGAPSDSYCNYNGDDATAWRVGLGILDWNGFYLTGIYESRDQEPGSGVFTAYTDPVNPANSYYMPLTAHDVELWQIQAGYAFGNNMIKAMYGQASYDSDVYLGANVVRDNGGAKWADSINDLTDYDVNTWAVGFDHNFSKRTKVYALYTEVDSDQEDWVAGSDWSGFSLGVVHKF